MSVEGSLRMAKSEARWCRSRGDEYACRTAISSLAAQWKELLQPSCPRSCTIAASNTASICSGAGATPRRLSEQVSSQCSPCVTHAACTELWYGTEWYPPSTAARNARMRSALMPSAARTPCRSRRAQPRAESAWPPVSWCSSNMSTDQRSVPCSRSHASRPASPPPMRLGILAARTRPASGTLLSTSRVSPAGTPPSLVHAPPPPLTARLRRLSRWLP
mmetsp:Transcript_4223/g.13315  ORF Transcript_4223/g.13315 Transcript_4223/m.13315 type:complete len:219 (-) Transcript_4223:20-676(-)